MYTKNNQKSKKRERKTYKKMFPLIIVSSAVELNIPLNTEQVI